MKRAIGLIFLFIACIAGFLIIKGILPFVPVLGHSMEPTLHSGSLLMIKAIDPGDVKVGDIIVYSVPPKVQDYYNYPPVVSHRVTEIKTMPTLGFSTKGDNIGEDPFTIGPMDIRGTVGLQIPFLGLPLLFFQNQQGLIYVATALVLLTIFLYSGELLHGGNLLRRRLFSPAINGEKRVNQVLKRKIDTTAQNHVLTALAETMDKTPAKPMTIAAREEPPAPARPPARYPKTAEKITASFRPQKPVVETVATTHGVPNRPLTPGYARKYPEPAKTVRETRDKTPTVFNRVLDTQGLTKEALAAEQEIFSALDRLHSRLCQSKSQG